MRQFKEETIKPEVQLCDECGRNPVFSKCSKGTHNLCIECFRTHHEPPDSPIRSPTPPRTTRHHRKSYGKVVAVSVVGVAVALVGFFYFTGIFGIDQLAWKTISDGIKMNERPNSILSDYKLTFLTSATNKPLKDAEIYLIPYERRPICITDKNGVCSVDLPAGENTLLIRLYTIGAGGERLNSFSHTEKIQIRADQEVILQVPVVFRAMFVIKDKSSGTPVEDAVIYINEKSYGSTNDFGELATELAEGSYNVRVEYTGKAGKVVEKVNVNVENKLRNYFSIAIPAFGAPSSSESSTTPHKQHSHEELVSHALELINKDRAKHGLNPVTLGSNLAAQKHAEDMLKNRFHSHWGSDGSKPYMRYTKEGGAGYVAENVASTSYPNPELCNSPYASCPPIDPREAIKEAQYGMMYDDADSNWGHRDNILDKGHTKVNVGIAYNETFFAFVQDFEGDYISWRKPITTSSTGSIEMSGTVNLKNFELFAIAIYYDKLPGKLTSAQLSAYPYNGAYDAGKEVDIVYPSPSPGYYYEDPTVHVANKWFSTYGVRDYEDFEIGFSMSDTLRKNGDGIYTIHLIAQNSNNEQVDLTNYSLKYQQGVISTLDGNTALAVSPEAEQPAEKQSDKIRVTVDKSTYVIWTNKGITIYAAIGPWVPGMPVSFEVIDPNGRTVNTIRSYVENDFDLLVYWNFPNFSECRDDKGSITYCYNKYIPAVGTWKVKMNYQGEVATTSFQVTKP